MPNALQQRLFADLPTDSTPEALRKAKAVRIASLVPCWASLIYVPGTIYNQQWPFTAICGFALLATPMGFWVSRRPRWIDQGIHLLMAILLVAAATVSWIAGGLQGLQSLWLLVIPVMAALLCKREHVLFWGIATAATAAAIRLGGLPFLPVVDLHDGGRGLYESFIDGTGTPLVIGACAWWLSSTVRRTDDEIAERQRALQTAEAALHAETEERLALIKQVGDGLKPPLHTLNDLHRRMADHGTLDPTTLHQLDANIQELAGLLNAFVVAGYGFEAVLPNHPKHLHVGHALEAMAMQAVPFARAAGLDLNLDLPPSLPAALLADPQHVLGAVRPVLHNALAFTHQGRVDVTVEWHLTDVSKEIGTLLITVRDNGPGISQDHIESIFQPWFTADTGLTRRAGGLGLGLATAQTHARTLGSAWRVQSIVGGHSTFKLSLALQVADRTPIAALNPPRVPPDTTADVRHLPPPARRRVGRWLAAWGLQPADDNTPADVIATGSGTPGPGRLILARQALPAAIDIQQHVLARAVEDACKSESTRRTEAPRVLVVDDQSLNLRLTAKMLSHIGCVSGTADSGLTALTLLAREPFDLVLMDIQMPGMTGLEATRRLRAAAHDQATLPVIALTAETSAAAVREVMHAGMDAHLPKPVRPDALRHMIARFVSWDAPEAV